MEQAKPSKQVTFSSGKALPAELNWIEWNIFGKHGLERICKLGLDKNCKTRISKIKTGLDLWKIGL